MTPSAVLAWAEDHPALAITAAVLALAVTAVVVLLAVRAAGRAARAGVRTAKGLDLVVVGAAGVALLATVASIEAMWVFLRDELHITDKLVRAAIVGIFDVAAFVGALLSREARIKAPGTFGADSLIVWAVASLLGYFGAAEASTSEGQVFRFAIPMLAAVMWDRVVHRDVSRKVSVDKAKMATVTGRIFAGIGGAFRSVKGAIVRQGARWGIFHPSDEDTTTIRAKRWRRQLISRAARAADALREIDATNDLPADDKRRRRAVTRYDRSVPRFRAAIVAGQQLGTISTREDLDQILWESAVVIRAEDALQHATGQSPWSTDATDRPTPAEADRPDVIDGEVIGRPEPADRTGDRPKLATDRPTDTEPTDSIGRTATDQPDRPATSTDRPIATQKPNPSDRPAETTGRQSPRPTDPSETRVVRPAGRRRSKEENEQRVRSAAESIIGDRDAVPMPSQGSIAKAAGISKSTVQAVLDRAGINGSPLLTRELVNAIPNHEIQIGEQS